MTRSMSVIRRGGGALLALGLAGAALAAPPTPLPASSAVLLAPGVPEAAPAAVARGVFSTTTVTITVPGGPVVLASSPDGTGALCSDDEARLLIVGAGQAIARWSHRFSSPDRRAIICLPPQQLELPAGRYQVAVELDDRDPPTYSSNPYYLVMPTPDVPAPPGGTPTLTAVAPVSVPPATPAPTASARPPDRPVPTAAPALPTTAPNRPILTGESPPVGMANRWLPPALLALVALFLLLSLRRRRRRRVAPPAHPGGIIDLADQHSREACTVIIGGELAIRRQPLAALPAAAAPPAQVIGYVRPTPEGVVVVDNATAAQPTHLRHNGSARLADGAVTLRYRAPAARASTPTPRMPRGGPAR